jgi:AraC-like DNA-binding protein
MKNSCERKETAAYLRAWRLFNDVKMVSNHFGNGTSKTCRILRRSKQYLRSPKRKGKVYRYLKVRWSPKRLLIAKYLRNWMSGLTVQEVANKYGVDKKTVLHHLQQSQGYCRCIRKLSAFDQMKIKKSPFRRKLAKYLSAWRKTRNVRQLESRNR